MRFCGRLSPSFSVVPFFTHLHVQAEPPARPVGRFVTALRSILRFFSRLHIHSQLALLFDVRQRLVPEVGGTPASEILYFTRSR